MRHGEVTSGEPIRVATHLAPSVLPAYAMATRRIGERLGRPAELVVAADYARCAADVDDVCFVCSIPYVLLAAEGRIQMAAVAAPILRGRRYGNAPVYFSDVVVRTDAPFRAFEELAGSRWAYNEPFSHSGFLVVLHHLARIGADPGFIGTWVEAGFHDDAIQMVLDGRADWAAVDTQVLDLWRRRRPMLRHRLRVLASLGPSTIQPVVVSTRRLDGADREAVTEALLDLHRDELGGAIVRGSGIERFVRIGDAEYADIRGMLEVTRASGLLPGWWDGRWAELTGGGVSPARRRSAAAEAPTPAGPPARTSSPRPSPPRS